MAESALRDIFQIRPAQQNRETPYIDLLKQHKEKDFVNRILNPGIAPAGIPWEGGSVASHQMAAEVDENGNWYVFPTIVNQGGKLVSMPLYDAFDYARETGEYIPMPDMDSAINFSENYKTKAMQDFFTRPAYRPQPQQQPSNPSALRRLLPSARDRILSQQGQMPTAPVPQNMGMIDRARRFTSLDAPQDMSFGETLADIGMGFAPGIGTAQGFRDFERARRDDDLLGMALGGISVLPLAGGLVKAGRAAGDIVEGFGDAAARAARGATSPLEGVVDVGYDVDAISRNYPVTGPGSLNFSNPKKPEGFLQKELTTEELALQRARNTAQRDIIAGKYDPYFVVEDRYFANPELYDLEGNTLIDAMPAKQATIDQYAERFDTPEIRENIRQAYQRGLSPSSQNWYAMGQLQDEFIRELGPIEGPKMFKERFADAMAATTGGADPTANLLMAAYVNNRKALGLPLPVGSTNYPHPIGGRYLAGNMAMADKIIMNETPLTAAGQPKRFNFSANFLGDMSRATIDEQMSQLYESGLTAPPGASYGVMERVLGDVGRELGVSPGNVQDVAWAGAKGAQGKPMMQHINEAIERTARVTNKTPREVLVDSIINARSPLYTAAGATIGLSALRNIQREDEQSRID